MRSLRATFVGGVLISACGGATASTHEPTPPIAPSARSAPDGMHAAPALDASAPATAIAPKPAPVPEPPRFSTFGRVGATGFLLTESGTAHLFDAATGTHVAFAPKVGDLRFARVALDREHLLLAGERGVGVYDVRGGELAHFDVPASPVIGAAALSRDGSKVMWVTDAIEIHDVATRALVRRIALGGELLNTDPRGNFVGFHADGEHIVVGDITQARVFQLKNGAEVGDGHSTDTGGTFGAILSPDATYVAAASGDGHVLTLYRTFPWKKTGVDSVQDCANHFLTFDFVNDGRSLAGFAQDLRYTVTRVDTGVRERTLRSKIAGGASDVSDDGAVLVTRRDDQHPVVFDVKKNAPLFDLPPGAETTMLSNDGKFVLAAHELTLQVLAIPSGTRAASWTVVRTL